MTIADGQDAAGASRSIAKNTMLLTLGLLSGRVLGVFLIRKMAPILGTEGMGIWGAAIDISAILQVVANFGLGTLLTREITRRPGHDPAPALEHPGDPPRHRGPLLPVPAGLRGSVGL